VRTGRISAEEAEAANVSANAQAPIQSARVIAEIEGAVVQEAKNVMSSSEFDRLRAAYMAGQPASVTIGGRVIQYEPNLPTEGMSLFGGNGFLLGPKAFASAREASATVLHELYRLYTSVGDQSGVYGDLARHESNAAHAFAQRAISSGVVGQ